MMLRLGIGAASATIFAGTAYFVGITYAPAPTFSVSNETRAAAFDTLAPTYEGKTRKQEFYLGIGRMRRRVLREEATGRVLEVGAGTGNNVGLYPADTVDEVIMCDRSGSMVQQIHQKIVARTGHEPYEYKVVTPLAAIESAATASAAHRALVAEAVGENGGPLTVPAIVAERVAIKHATLPRVAERSTKVDAQGRPEPERTRQFVSEGAVYSVATAAAERLPFPDASFDTVVDMFGLCSFDDPIVALKEMARVCKPDGKLLLLEHGRGSSSNLNWYLDKWAPRHAKSWGCWWNRDIRRIIRMSGCHLVRREEKHFGTTHLMILTPSGAGFAAAQQQAELTRKRQESLKVAEERKKHDRYRQ